MSAFSDPDFASAHAKVRALCDHFDAHRTDFDAPGYKEANARDEFITPFFEALGWDVLNASHRSVYEKDVVTEKREDIAGSARSADYAFRRPGTHLTAFFVEAKKPTVELHDHAPCYQAVLYGWNASTPLVVLASFKQLLILDARSRPDKNNATRHILRSHGSFAYSDYRAPEKFAEIWGLFARANVAGGSIEKARAALPRLSGRIQKDELFARGTRPVDEEFLAQMELWREQLAKSLKRSNRHLGGERLTSLTQRILDRLVFLRFLQDRGIEREVTFAEFGKSGSAWSDFLSLSRRLDARYNGIIYKKDVEGCEDPTLVVDDTVFVAVVEGLVPENSDYLFGSIPVTILGSIYERFLGNVIVSRDKTAIVEPKPDVRKAGGVYYTPDYVVRYILEQTVGRSIAGKKPAEIASQRFADIACGSGSFLVEVFAVLIRYHLAWYLADDPRKWERKGVLRQREIDGDYVLTLAEKRRLLLACVFGVDIDPQATEVTQLSLYLRLMEDESFPSTQALFDFEKRALLPNLRDNIVCGNSLVQTDVSDLFGLSAQEAATLRPLDLAWAFSQIRPDKSGALFDAVVGNPPYVRQEQLKKLKHYLETHFDSFAGTADLYAFFMERGVKLLKPGGRYGIIVSSSFLRANFGEALRETLKKQAAVERIVDFGGLAVFSEAKDTYVCIPLLQRAPQPARIEIAHVRSLEPAELESQMRATDYTVPQERLDAQAWSLASDAEIAVFDKLKAQGRPLGEVVMKAMYFGIKTGLKEAFTVDTATYRHMIGAKEASVVDETRRTSVTAHTSKSAKLLHPCRGGEDVREYFIRPRDEWLLVIPCGYTRAAMKASGALSERAAWEWMTENFGRIAEHLAHFEKSLKARQDQGEFWWELRPCDYYDVLERPKIVFPDICKNPRFCYDDTGIYVTNTAYFLGTGDKYLLGLLNSPVFWFCMRHISIPFGIRAGEYRYRMFYQYVEQVPIRVVDPSDRVENALRERLIGYVDRILAAKKVESLSEGRVRETSARQCEALERQIDELVYELYGLTEQERAIVERGAKGTEADA